jgi:hypothetical protein
MNESLYEIAFRELSSRTGDVKPSDVVLFSEPLRSALNFVIRLKRFSLATFCEKLGFTRYQSRRIADILVERHLFFLQPDPSNPDEIFYEARLSAPARPSTIRKSVDIWKKIE